MNAHTDTERRVGLGEDDDGRPPRPDQPGPDDRRLEKLWLSERTRRTRTWTPFLVVPYLSVVPLVPGQPVDHGRVRPVPSGHAYWASPYIVVENSGGVGLTARAGEDNFVHARVFNFGKASSAPTQVDFYWANPALGLGPGTFHHIGSQWVELRHGHSMDVRCDAAWVPTFLNEGHECLMVNTASPMTAAGPGPLAGPFDPLQVPFAPVLDRHVGQRNLTVLPAGPGAPMPIVLDLNNVLPFRATMVVAARAACFEVDRRLLDEVGEVAVLTGLAGLAGTRELPRKGPVRVLDAEARVSVEVGDAIGWLDPAQARTFAARLVEHLPVGQGEQHGQVLARVELKAGEQRRVEVVVDVPDGLGTGDVVVVDVAQLWDGRALGGYTMIGVVG